MKKFKFILMSTTIALAIGSAFAFKFKAPCEYSIQYRLYNGNYVLAGTYAVDYVCSGSLGVCTWYKPWPTSDYVPCRSGTYIPIE